MPVPANQHAIQAEEGQLGGKLPPALCDRLMHENGGEVWAAGDDWELHPVRDTTNKKTLRRTAYHIARETQIARAWRDFPQDAISIAANGTGDRLMVRSGSDAVELWNRETGESQPVGVIWDPYAVELGDRAVENIVSLSPEDRYDYFVRRAVATEEIWALADDRGWVLSSDDEGMELFPVWPDLRFAVAECADARPVAIALSEWLVSWTPNLASTNRRVSVFPSLTGVAVVAHPERLKQDLEEELSLLE